MTNNLEEAEEAINKTDYRMLNIHGIAGTAKKGWQRIHSTFGGFGLFISAIEQLIEIHNMLLQHYHTGTPLSRKSNKSNRYL